MSRSQPARTAGRRSRSVVLVALAVAALGAVLGHQSSAATPSPALPSSAAPRPHDEPPRLAAAAAAGGAQLWADGDVPDGLTVFDDDVPAVTNLDPDLLDALRRAATQASADGITVVVNSGWRSRAYQDRLLGEAVAEYGSAEEAARWVATADTSPHVQGDAVDVGPWDATTWLSQHGAGYGLCQIYDNEPWHYELRPDAVADGCPARYADPTHDPRMQQ